MTTPVYDAVRATDYAMTETVQWTTLGIAAAVLVILVLGVWSLAVECMDRWSIEDAEADIDDMTADLFMGRDQHHEALMCGRWAS